MLTRMNLVISISKYHTINPQKFKMEIFSRSGQLLFTSDDINQGWDGRKEGKKEICPTGIYIYNIEVVDIFNQIFKHVDDLLLIR